MDYVLQFGIVWRDFDTLLFGAWLTIRLSAIAMVFGLAVGVLGALARASASLPLRAMARAYVEGIRNTPFLVQVLLVYLGLPSIGIRLRPDQAALLAMIVNLGAYTTEIVRAGIKAVPHGQMEAGRALGLSPWHIFRFVVFLPALRAVFPALASQFILLLLGSSVVSAISANELTAIANTLQSTTFRAFEVYIVVTLMYLAIAMAFRALFAGIYWFVFVRGREA